MTRIHSIFPVPFPGVSVSVPLQAVPYSSVPGKTDGCRKLLLFLPEEGRCLPTSCRDSFIKLPAAVCQAAYQNHIFNPSICGITVTVQQPFESGQEFDRVFPASAGSVIVKHDPRKPIASTQIDPHIRF